ncbi:hypothetical protein [uncultured Desulfovibrio sp.]|uniref:hypothetical protein n=1 Tax=uncultured Desulfovibrio sp. TaxID=167968 RepID=UPI002711F444|nr:hypothetical protein [uncultured Desulfovibrio sp.]
MSRYRTYLKIIDECDKALQQKGMRLLEGKVTPENLACLEKILCIMHKAWQVAWEIDRLDDIGKAMSEAHKAEQPAPGGEAMPVSATAGRDFRGGRAYPGSAPRPVGLDLADLWPAQGGGSPLSAARAIRDALEELEMVESRRGGRRGFPATARRRARSEDERDPETDFVLVPGLGMPFYGRTGYDADPAEANEPYAMTGNGQHEARRARNGLVHAPVQSAATDQTARAATTPASAPAATGQTA